MKTTTIKFPFFLIVILLSACGGGSSSGPSISFTVGVYEGTQTLTFTAPDNPNQTLTIPFSMSVTETTVTIFDPGFSGSGLISRDGDYSVSISDIPVRVNGDTCDMSLVYTGTALGNMTNGTIEGSVPCPFFPAGFLLTVTGSFQGTISSGGAAKQTSEAISDIIINL